MSATLTAPVRAEPPVTANLEQLRMLPPGAIYATGSEGHAGAERYLLAIETAIGQIPSDPSTPEGREIIRAAAFRVRQTKTVLDTMGKTLTEVWRQKTAAVNASRAMIRERLDALALRVRAPLTHFEMLDEQRVLDHEMALADLAGLTVWPDGVLVTACLIESRLEIARRRTNRDWQEFADRAEKIRNEVIARLVSRLAEAQQREKDAAELQQLRTDAAARFAAEAARREQAAPPTARQSAAAIEETVARLVEIAAIGEIPAQKIVHAIVNKSVRHVLWEA